MSLVRAARVLAQAPYNSGRFTRRGREIVNDPKLEHLERRSSASVSQLTNGHDVPVTVLTRREVPLHL